VVGCTFAPAPTLSRISFAKPYQLVGFPAVGHVQHPARVHLQ
jgi:hypothetical protein